MPTFPSKSIDYMRNKVPMLVSTEEGTDFRTLVSQAGAALSSIAGDHAAFLENLVRLSSDAALRKEMGQHGLEYFLANHNVAVVADNMVRWLSDGSRAAGDRRP